MYREQKIISNDKNSTLVTQSWDDDIVFELQVKNKFKQIWNLIRNKPIVFVNMNPKIKVEVGANGREDC